MGKNSYWLAMLRGSQSDAHYRLILLLPFPSLQCTLSEKNSEKPNSTQILHIPCEAAGSRPAQSQASAVPFSSQIHAIPCKQGDEVAGQEALAVSDVWRWPPGPWGEDSAPAAAAALPSAGSAGGGSWQRLPSAAPRRQLAPPAPGRRKQSWVTWRCSKARNEWSWRAFWRGLRAVLPRAKERKSASVGVWLAGFLSE